MTGEKPLIAPSEVASTRYEDNFSRHLLGVSRYLQTRLMDTLQRDCGHRDLRLAFAPYITLVGSRGKRLSDLAEILGISRQACNQAANQIEAAGYIARTADPTDGRAKTLVLTARGRRLRDDGINIVSQLDGEFARLVGDEAVADAGKTLSRLHRGLALGAGVEDRHQLPVLTLGGFLPRLADYTSGRLMEYTRARGHRGLKLSFGQVLTLIGSSGGRIQQIAAIQDVSKQAISAIAIELEERGYLRREPDPADARQVVLRFTDRGRTLIADSVASVDDLEAEFVTITSGAAIKRLKATLGALYRALDLEQDLFVERSPVNIALLARQLQQQLGAQASQALAQYLLTPPRRERS